MKVFKYLLVVILLLGVVVALGISIKIRDDQSSKNSSAAIDKNDACIQVIACGENGITYPTPCDAERAGIKVICYHECPCEQNDESENQCLAMDINGDTTLTLVDLSALISHYNTYCTNKGDYSPCGSQDKNGDGKVSLIDLASLLSRYRKANCSI